MNRHEFDDFSSVEALRIFLLAYCLGDGLYYAVLAYQDNTKFTYQGPEF